MAVLNVRVDDELYETMRKLAYVTRLPMTEIIRRALGEYLARDECSHVHPGQDIYHPDGHGGSWGTGTTNVVPYGGGDDGSGSHVTGGTGSAWPNVGGGGSAGWSPEHLAEVRRRREDGGNG